MPHLIIEGKTASGDMPFRYEVVGTLDDALATLNDHVKINGNRQLQTTPVQEGVVRVRGSFRDSSNQRIEISIFEHVVEPEV